MTINYQDAIDLFVDFLRVAAPIGLIWAILERLLEMFYCAATDRFKSYFK